VRVAIIGVGNCASALVQGVEYYKKANDSDIVPGLMHVNLGGYHISDIEFSAAIDIDKNKVGKDLSEAIFTKPNCTKRFVPNIPLSGIKVARGMTHDGLGKYLSQVIEKAPGDTANIVQLLQDTHTDVVVSFLPVGTESGTKWYVERILEAGCAFVNCIPVFIAREPYWQSRFKDKGLPVLGDDIKSQVGATILHRMLTNLFIMRGMPIDTHFQINYGGNTDFLNMLERSRLKSKKISKTNAVASQLENAGFDVDPQTIHVGPSDHISWLNDNKRCDIEINGRHFGGVPMKLTCRLSVEDSPNSAGIVIDAVRIAKLALNHKLSGAIEGPSSYFFKSPPIQPTDDEAKKLTEKFIKKYGL